MGYSSGLVHLVEHVHELHRLGLHLTTDLVKLCDEVVVSEERHDTDARPPTVVTSARRYRLRGALRRRRPEPALAMSKKARTIPVTVPRKPIIGAPGSNGSEDRKTLLQTTDLDVTGILDDHEDVRHGAADTGKPLADHTSIGGCWCPHRA